MYFDTLPEMTEKKLSRFFDIMVTERAKESGKHIDIIINELSRHYDIEEKEIVRLLKTANSIFTGTFNKVIGFIDGEAIKRTTYHMQIKKIFTKVCSKLDSTDLNQDDINTINETFFQFSRGKI